MLDDAGLCGICKEKRTVLYIEIKPGTIVHVCPECMGKTRDNFIWFCTCCGRTYMRPKATVLDRLEGPGVDRICGGLQLVQGVDACLECNPLGVLDCLSREEHEELTGSCCGL